MDFAMKLASEESVLVLPGYDNLLRKLYIVEAVIAFRLT